MESCQVLTALIFSIRSFGMNYNITFPNEIIGYTNAGGMVLISILIVAAAIILIRYSANILSAIAGLLIYMIVGVVGLEVVTMIISVIPGLGEALLGNAISFCILRAIIFAAIMHAVRWFVVKITDRKGDLDIGSALMSGWGIALGQSIVSGMDLLYISTLGNTINMYGVEEITNGMTTEEIQGLCDSVNQLSEVPASYFLFKGLNGAVDVLFNVFIFVMVYAIVKKGMEKKWYAVVATITGFMSMLTYFYDYRVFSESVIMSVLKLIVLAGVFAFVLNIDTKFLNGELRSFDKMKKKTMPKYSNSLRNK